MKPIIIFDLDGTLSDTSRRLHYIQPPGKPNWDAFFDACDQDEPHAHLCDLLNTLVYTRYYDIRIWSGRNEVVRAKTERWIDHYVCALSMLTEIRMRKAGDRRPDDVIKKEWLDSLTPAERARIAMAFDDRDRMVRMYRAAGIPCMQVAEGDF